uniref:Uncharacterized protein n=1 Tax=Arundo donax TaxID=35708 RepID=A0A0A9AZW1_ARUDO
MHRVLTSNCVAWVQNIFLVFLQHLLLGIGFKVQGLCCY